jgi:hypothetical protein
MASVAAYEKLSSFLLVVWKLYTPPFRMSFDIDSPRIRVNGGIHLPLLYLLLCNKETGLGLVQLRNRNFVVKGMFS